MEDAIFFIIFLVGLYIIYKSREPSMKVDINLEVLALDQIRDVVCKPVVEGLVAGLLTQVPSAWECKGGKVSDELKLKLLEQCSKVL